MTQEQVEAAKQAMDAAPKIPATLEERLEAAERDVERHKAALAEVARELALRRNVYPKWIQSGRMGKDEAAGRLATLQTAIDILQASQSRAAVDLAYWRNEEALERRVLFRPASDVDRVAFRIGVNEFRDCLLPQSSSSYALLRGFETEYIGIGCMHRGSSRVGGARLYYTTDDFPHDVALVVAIGLAYRNCEAYEPGAPDPAPETI